MTNFCLHIRLIWNTQKEEKNNAVTSFKVSSLYLPFSGPLLDQKIHGPWTKTQSAYLGKGSCLSKFIAFGGLQVEHWEEGRKKGKEEGRKSGRKEGEKEGKKRGKKEGREGEREGCREGGLPVSQSRESPWSSVRRKQISLLCDCSQHSQHLSLPLNLQSCWP